MKLAARKYVILSGLFLFLSSPLYLLAEEDDGGGSCGGGYDGPGYYGECDSSKDFRLVDIGFGGTASSAAKAHQKATTRINKEIIKQACKPAGHPLTHPYGKLAGYGLAWGYPNNNDFIVATRICCYSTNK